jgi:hypothetical protein
MSKKYANQRRLLALFTVLGGGDVLSVRKDLVEEVSIAKATVAGYCF